MMNRVFSIALIWMLFIALPARGDVLPHPILLDTMKEQLDWETLSPDDRVPLLMQYRLYLDDCHEIRARYIQQLPDIDPPDCDSWLWDHDGRLMAVSITCLAEMAQTEDAFLGQLVELSGDDRADRLRTFIDSRKRDRWLAIPAVGKLFQSVIDIEQAVAVDGQAADLLMTPEELRRFCMELREVAADADSHDIYQPESKWKVKASKLHNRWSAIKERASERLIDAITTQDAEQNQQVAIRYLESLNFNDRWSWILVGRRSEAAFHMAGDDVSKQRAVVDATEQWRGPMAVIIASNDVARKLFRAKIGLMDVTGFRIPSPLPFEEAKALEPEANAPAHEYSRQLTLYRQDLSDIVADGDVREFGKYGARLRPKWTEETRLAKEAEARGRSRDELPIIGADWDDLLYQEVSFDQVMECIRLAIGDEAIASFDPDTEQAIVDAFEQYRIRCDAMPAEILQHAKEAVELLEAAERAPWDVSPDEFPDAGQLEGSALIIAIYSMHVQKEVSLLAKDVWLLVEQHDHKQAVRALIYAEMFKKACLQLSGAPGYELSHEINLHAARARIALKHVVADPVPVRDDLLGLGCPSFSDNRNMQRFLNAITGVWLARLRVTARRLHGPGIGIEVSALDRHCRAKQEAATAWRDMVRTKYLRSRSLPPEVTLKSAEIFTPYLPCSYWQSSGPATLAAARIEPFLSAGDNPDVEQRLQEIADDIASREKQWLDECMHVVAIPYFAGGIKGIEGCVQMELQLMAQWCRLELVCETHAGLLPPPMNLRVAP